MSIPALKLVELLPKHPIVTISAAMKLIGTTKPTANRAIELLVNAGVLAETTGSRRDRSCAYQRYLERLRVGTDLDSIGKRPPVKWGRARAPRTFVPAAPPSRWSSTSPRERPALEALCCPVNAWKLTHPGDAAARPLRFTTRIS